MVRVAIIERAQAVDPSRCAAASPSSRRSCSSGRSRRPSWSRSPCLTTPTWPPPSGGSQTSCRATAQQLLTAAGEVTSVAEDITGRLDQLHPHTSYAVPTPASPAAPSLPDAAQPVNGTVKQRATPKGPSGHPECPRPLPRGSSSSGPHSSPATRSAVAGPTTHSMPCAPRGLIEGRDLRPPHAGRPGRRLRHRAAPHRPRSRGALADPAPPRQSRTLGRLRTLELISGGVDLQLSNHPLRLVDLCPPWLSHHRGRIGG